MDSSGNLFIADSGNNVIREVSGGNITTYSSEADSRDVSVRSRKCVLVDSARATFISADSDGLRDAEVSAGNPSVHRCGGQRRHRLFRRQWTRPGCNTRTIPKASPSIRNGYLYIADTINSRIRKVSPDGIITTIAGAGNPLDMPAMADRQPMRSSDFPARNCCGQFGERVCVRYRKQCNSDAARL